MLCRKNNVWWIIAIAIMVAISIANKSRADTFEGIGITRTGSGPAVIFIPGLNSATDTFIDTCAHFKTTRTCHLLQLPGFAGQPALTTLPEYFLAGMRDRIVRYIKTHKLEHVTLIGHSLGGTLSLMIALDAPELIDKIVIVDAVPFFAAIHNAALTVDMARPQAEQLRSAMQQQSAAEYQKNAAANLQGMSNNPARLPLLQQWSKNSDRATTTQAMYELMTTDLRSRLGEINKPVLVLGAWAAYKTYGATKAGTQNIFSHQYAQLHGVDIRMSETGFHFLTWDDNAWVNQQISEFLSRKPEQ